MSHDLRSSLAFAFLPLLRRVAFLDCFVDLLDCFIDLVVFGQRLFSVLRFLELRYSCFDYFCVRRLFFLESAHICSSRKNLQCLALDRPETVVKVCLLHQPLQPPPVRLHLAQPLQLHQLRAQFLLIVLLQNLWLRLFKLCKRPLHRWSIRR